MRDAHARSTAPRGDDVHIHEVIIEVGDIDAAIGFYRDVLGLVHVRTVEHDGARIAEMDADGQRVSLVAGERSGVRLAFGTASARSRERRLKANGIEAEGGGPFDVDGGRWLGFADPWGNRLGCWEPEDGTRG
jgi:catechol 2,3-dioxygenase-like lactoylglutathione lyase family enzyme